jgi:AraC-like DNA-binding protein
MKAKFERVIAGEGRLFAAFESWGSRFHAPHHFHPELELTGILGGDGRRIIGDSIEAFAAGDLVLIGANVPHQYSSTGSSLDAGARAGSVVIQFLPEVFGTAFLESRDGAPVRRLMGRAGRGLAFTGSVVREVAGRMRALVAGSGPRRFVLLIEILELLARSRRARELASRGFSPVRDCGEASRVSRACDFIQKRFGQDIAQTDAAAQVALSPSAFSRMFRSATGLTFTAFLTGVRVSEACRRLLETDETVAEIAFLCGFNNLSNFNRRFLAAKGLTPREYRRACSV